MDFIKACALSTADLLLIFLKVMHLLIATLATAALSFASLSRGLNIIVNNDDGFGSANIREFYRLLRAAGHDAIIVAPVVDNSGQGGRVSHIWLLNPF